MAFINRIRLPLQIDSPQFPEDKDTFRFADGTIKTLSVVIHKEYELITDNLPPKIHERIKVALAHDNLEFEGEFYIGGAAQEGQYDIAYPNFMRRQRGQGTTKIRVTPYDATNSNCGTCETYQQINANDDNVGTLTENETIDVAVLYNDSICCDPFSITIVTFNTDYLASCTVIGNVLRLTTKTGLTTQNNVILATYRVMCDGNGMFDEANVIGNITGTVEGCLSPLAVTPTLIGQTTARFDITPPDPAPACGYNYILYEAQTPGVPIAEGTTPDLELIFHGLASNTDHKLYVQGNCCDDLVSNFVEVDFTTLPPSGGGGGDETTCGRYDLSFTDPEGQPGSYIQIQYKNCFGNLTGDTILNGQTMSRCLQQMGEGNPTVLEVTFYTGGGDTPVNVNYLYTAPC